MIVDSIWTNLSATPHSLGLVQAGPWRTRVLEAGEGEPLLLMHGTGGHLEAYARNISALSASFRVIAFDFAGHGRTTPAQADLEMEDYVDQVRCLLDVLGIDKAHLAGESLGGWVSVKFAAAHPERCRKLLLNTPGGTMATPEVMDRIRTLSQAAADDPSDERIRARLEWLMASNDSVTDELVRIRQEIYAQDGFSESMRHILCLQDPVVRERNRITDDELAAVPNGALVVWTSDDPSGPASAGMHMAERIHAGEFHCIENAGHWPQWEQAAEFNARILEYLSE